MKQNSMALLVLTICLGGSAVAHENVPTVQQDRSDISQIIYRWGFYRDHGMWDELKDTFHPGGEIQVTWYVGKFDGFVEASKEMAERGAKSAHIMKPSIIDVEGDRAIAITPVSITARAKPDGTDLEVDVNSTAQFYDFLERKSGEWRITRRTCVYQLDRMDSVVPSLKFWLMSLFMDTDKFDPAYRFLAFGLESQGFPIQPGQVVDNTEESRELYQEGQDWLHAGS